MNTHFEWLFGSISLLETGKAIISYCWMYTKKICSRWQLIKYKTTKGRCISTRQISPATQFFRLPQLTVHRNCSLLFFHFRFLARLVMISSVYWLSVNGFTRLFEPDFFFSTNIKNSNFISNLKSHEIFTGILQNNVVIWENVTQ